MTKKKANSKDLITVHLRMDRQAEANLKALARRADISPSKFVEFLVHCVVLTKFFEEADRAMLDKMGVAIMALEENRGASLAQSRSDPRDVRRAPGRGRIIIKEKTKSEEFVNVHVRISRRAKANLQRFAREVGISPSNLVAFLINRSALTRSIEEAHKVMLDKLKVAMKVEGDREVSAELPQWARKIFLSSQDSQKNAEGDGGLGSLGLATWNSRPRRERRR